MFRTIAVCSVAALSQVSHAGMIDLISDTEMSAGNWSAFIHSQGGGFSFSTLNPAAGGNPGAYRWITHSSATGFTHGTVAHLHSIGWDPASMGAITSLDMRIDVNCFNGGTSAAVGFGLIVEQGGTIYFGPTFTALTASGWRTDLNHVGLSALSFSNSGVNPDFSASGMPVRFGFYSSNGTGLSTPISSSSGADNFFVRVVPGPGSALMVTALGLMTPRRRR